MKKGLSILLVALLSMSVSVTALAEGNSLPAEERAEASTAEVSLSEDSKASTEETSMEATQWESSGDEESTESSGSSAGQQDAGDDESSQSSGLESSQEESGKEAEFEQFYSSIPSSGTIPGTEIQWEVMENGESPLFIRISGKGDIPDFDQQTNQAPWVSYSDPSFIIEPGITSIGNSFFVSYSVYGANSIFVFPDTVKEIAPDAFIMYPSAMAGIYGRRGSAAEEYAKRKGISFYQHPTVVSNIDGSNVGYELDWYKGKLTLFGNGALTNSTIPNESGANRIPQVVVEGSLRTIPADFMSYGSTRTIYLENGITSVGEKAFFSNYFLRSLYIPPSVTSIGSGAFSQITTSRSPVVYGQPGSYAEQWAQEQHFAFEAYTFTDNPGPLTGWVYENGQHYYYSRGEMLTGWHNIEGHERYFWDNGTMAKGWSQIDGRTYYMTEYGLKTTGWATVDGALRYFGSDGKMRTGWHEVDGYTRYFNQYGIMLTGWQSIDGATRYFNEYGVLATGWTVIDGTTRHFDRDGVMSTGWKEVDGAMRYFDQYGVMYCGLWTIDGVQHYFNEYGGLVW